MPPRSFWKSWSPNRCAILTGERLRLHPVLCCRATLTLGWRILAVEAHCQAYNSAALKKPKARARARLLRARLLRPVCLVSHLSSRARAFNRGIGQTGTLQPSV